MATKSATPNRLTPPSVIGLEGSRKLADQRHRRKRLKARITSSVVIAILMGVAAGAGYVVYAIYDQQRADEQVENERRQAEIDAERQRQTTDDLIDQLQNTPRWNGPGAPAFGVGDEVGDGAGIEITDGNVDG
jgi:uncharacterized protein HemX